jgi:hypothetical protein
MRKLLYALVGLFLFISCSKNDVTNNNGNGGGPLNEPGYGASNATFKHSPWQLPAGISLKEKIHYFEYCDSDPNANNRKNWVGVPNGWLTYFAVCIVFTNDTEQPIEIPLPPVIIIESVDIHYQNGMIITDINKVTVPAKSSVKMFSPVFCLNLLREAPLDVADDEGNLIEFNLGPTQIPAALQEVVDIIRAKKLSYTSVLNPDGTENSDKLYALKVIQDAIWEVTDEDGLTPETKQALLAL